MLNLALIVLSVLLSSHSYAFITDAEIASFKRQISDRPIGERIAFWAERFVGTPYDPDPLGEYVTKNVVIADERVDCMYLSFRSVELALSPTPEDAVSIALDKRFINAGRIEGGKVVNYEDRFQYGEDMLDSGKWGREITEKLGQITEIKGSRGRERVKILSKEAMMDLLLNAGVSVMPLQSGDFIFFIKSPGKRQADEIVGHIGIIKVERDGVYLIHASGIKKKGGAVKKVLLKDYISDMPFPGVRISRFD